jgi:hypothetical protein
MEDDNDAVGYKRPPKSKQYKPGQSGNPSGRKKKVANLKNDLAAELRESIVVHENGRVRRITKQQAFIKALMALAIKGDIRAINAIVACTRNFGAPDQVVEDGIGSEDLTLLQDYLDRERQRRQQLPLSKLKKESK